MVYISTKSCENTLNGFSLLGLCSEKVFNTITKGHLSVNIAYSYSSCSLHIVYSWSTVVPSYISNSFRVTEPTGDGQTYNSGGLIINPNMEELCHLWKQKGCNNSCLPSEIMVMYPYPLILFLPDPMY